MFIVVGPALVTEIKYQPPFLGERVAAVILTVTFRPLRGPKGFLIALQYHYRTSEGGSHRKPISKRPSFC